MGRLGGFGGVLGLGDFGGFCLFGELAENEFVEMFGELVAGVPEVELVVEAENASVGRGVEVESHKVIITFYGDFGLGVFRLSGECGIILRTEGCPSGLRSTLGKRVRAQALRRFESCPFRHEKSFCGRKSLSNLSKITGSRKPQKVSSIFDYGSNFSFVI